MRQFLVNVILRLWKIMPLRLKLWAFMNDDMPLYEWRTELPDFRIWGFHKVPEVEFRLEDGRIECGPYIGYGLFGKHPHHYQWPYDVVAWRPKEKADEI